MRYKIGDIVLCTSEYDGNRLVKNKLGKIIEFSNPEINYGYGIEFFKKISIKGHTCGGIGKNGYCWYIDKEYVIKINKLKLQKLLEK